MKHIAFSKISSAVTLLGGSLIAASAWAQPAQGGYGPGNGMGPGMMGNGYGGGGWMGGGWMGGYGGIWLPILLVVVIAGVVAWIVSQKKK